MLDEPFTLLFSNAFRTLRKTLFFGDFFKKKLLKISSILNDKKAFLWRRELIKFFVSHLQWKSHNVSTFGWVETDNINQMITLTGGLNILIHLMANDHLIEFQLIEIVFYQLIKIVVIS